MSSTARADAGSWRRRQRLGLAGVGLVALAVIAALATTLQPPRPSTVVLAELVSSNASSIADEDGDHADWIELHNPTGEARRLDGWYLTDDPADLQQWTFPDVTLQPDERVLVWLSGKDRRDVAGELHTNFALAQVGEPLLLVQPDGATVADRVEPVALPRDASYGRDPDEPGRWCFFAEPSPGEPNTGACHADADLGAPVLSAPSGFYDDAFELRIEVAGGEPVYVTLDGSYPDPQRNADATQVYDQPLRIEDRSDEPDRFATIPTTFPFDASFHGDGWREPDGPQPKATVVRARTASGRETVATYFVGDHLRRPDLPVLHLATDANHLFDHDDGIYVPGRVYDDYLASDEAVADHGWNVPANFSQEGRAWERPHADDLARAVHMTWCEAGGACTYGADLGIRIHGGYSRRLPAKSLRLYARNDYGNRTFDHDFFAAAQAELPSDQRAPIGHRRLLVRNGGGTWGLSFLNDALFLDVARGMHLDTHAVQPMVLFVNGEYWGIHLLHERYDRHYLEAVHGVDPADVTILEARFALDTGVAGDEQHFFDVLDLLTEADQVDADTLRAVEASVDLDSFIDYVILQTFVSNTDWPHNNVQMWRTRTVDADGPPLADARWRWKAYDLDRVGGSVWPNDPADDNLARLLAPVADPRDGTGIPFLLQQLLRNDDFQARFVTRFADHLNTTFRAERVEAHLDRLAGLLEPEMPAQVARWGYPASVADWSGYVEDLRSYARQRPEQQWSQLLDHLDLDGTIEVRVEQSSGGTVHVNSLEVTADAPGFEDGNGGGGDGGGEGGGRGDGGWTGTYPAGVAMRLVAVPEADQRFVGFEGLPAGATLSDHEAGPGVVVATFAPDADVTVSATFAPA
ncbi:CotH kinase family protein [Egicoccus sp. AB-alg6-2]|uniref:CotH kinase family protein n=1 Tax=Egicoccus sp. AB-alg6-2 TaxID=3242692 RepID=UPI00359EDD79